MKRYILKVLVLLLLSAAGRAQEYGLYLMPDVWNSNYLNPGQFPRQNVVVALPSVYGSFQLQGAGRNRLFSYDAAEDVHYLNFSDVLGNLRGDLVSRNDFQADALGAGIRFGRLFVSAGTSTRVEANVEAPESLLRLLWEGTESQLDQALRIGPSLEGIAYQKVSLGFSYPVTPRLSMGLRINRLLGLASFRTQRNNLTLLQNSEIYQTTAAIDYQVSYFSGGQLVPIDKTVEGFENFADEISEDDLETGDATSFRDINQRNNGWGLDLGAELLLTDRLTLSASILDLGSIRWKNGVQQVRVGGEVTFEGLDVIELEEAEEFEVIPGLDTIGTFEAVSNVAYTQPLTPRAYLGANYRFSPLFEGGALLYNEFASYGAFSALSLLGRLHLGRIFHLGANYTFQTRTPSALGANVALKLGPVQLYAIGDNLFPVLSPRRVEGMNFRAGLNLTFGRKKSEERLTTLRAPLAEAAQWRRIVGRTPRKKKQFNPARKEKEIAADKALPTPASKEQKEAAGITVTPAPEKKEKQATAEHAPPRPRAPLPKQPEEEKPAGTATEKDEAEPVAEAGSAADGPRIAKPKKKKRSGKGKVEPAEETTAPLPAPKAAATPDIFAQVLEFRDENSRDLLGAIYVDIYEVDAEGNRILLRTGRHPGGRLSLQLPPDTGWYEMEVKAYQYEALRIRFRPLPQEPLEGTWYLSQTEDD